MVGLFGSGSEWVAISIDPFFFKVTPDPCQPIQDAIDADEREIQQLIVLLSNPGVPPIVKAQAKITLQRLERALPLLEAQLKTCRATNP